MKHIIWRSIYVALIVMLLDALWLGLFMRNFYNTQFQHVGRIMNGSLQPDVPASIIAYILLIACIVLLVIPFAQIGQTYIEQFMRGALCGCIIYGIYNFTNAAIVANWPQPVVYIDVIWGGLLFGLTSVGTLALHRIMGK